LAALLGVALTTSAIGGVPRAAAAEAQLIDSGSLNAIARMTGAQAMWDSGFTGQGVGVAVIDTGVARVAGLDRNGKVIDGPDLSFDSQNPRLVNVDGFGHGTHVAGIIAGSDVATGKVSGTCSSCTGASAYSDTTKFVGIAPDARILNVKVGAYDGAVDVSQVIAGIDWVVQHRNDNGMNVRVINLSYGTQSLQSADVDPLAYAVEQAWRAGIVVVAAGGNDGESVAGLADPAYSPAVISVGTIDPMGTLTPSDDVVPAFAQHGTAQRGIDVSAPGISVMSLRVPNGFVDQNVSTGKVGTRFQRASGTSQSTAVVSGLVALLLSKFPSATPDQVKAILMGSAASIAQVDSNRREFAGAGLANLGAVATGTLSGLLNLVGSLLAPTPSNGLGSLEKARGNYHVLSYGRELRGEVDIFSRPWVALTMTLATRLQLSWLGGSWNGSVWTKSALLGTNWSPAAWAGSDWSGARWSGARWSDESWDGARWSGARWSDVSWSGARWSDSGWEGARWSGARWSDASWS
jgi:serine protease AprX